MYSVLIFVGHGDDGGGHLLWGRVVWAPGAHVQEAGEGVEVIVRMISPQ